MRRVALLWLLAVGVLFQSSLLVHAYEGDHYTWTYYVALHLGFTKRQAFQIASGAYAIDWDPDTGPMEATAGDVIYGARHPGLTGTSHPQIASIWTQFHAFAETNYVGVGDEVEKARQRQKAALWKLAKAQRNPGPLLHFTQDYYSHFEFDNFHGHAIAGHKPDFISNDLAKARAMTEATVEVLQRFMREVMGKEPKEPDYDRLWEVLDRLAQADPAPNVSDLGNYNPYGGSGSPSLNKSLDVIRKAIWEDEADGRLPRYRYLAPWSSSPVLPSKWYEYEYDAQGRVGNARFPVERPELQLLTEQVEVKPGRDWPGDESFRITLRLSYRLSGLLDLKDGYGNPYLSPLPVIEQHKLSDELWTVASASRRYPREFEVERWNGEFMTEIEIERPKSELEKGTLTWTCVIQPHGFEPQSRQVKIPLPSTTAPTNVVPAILGPPAKQPALTGFRLEFVDIVPNWKPEPKSDGSAYTGFEGAVGDNPKWEWKPAAGGGSITWTGKGPTYSVKFTWTGPGQQIGPNGAKITISVTINPPQPNADLAAGTYVKGEGIELVDKPGNYAEVYKVAKNGQSDGGSLTVDVKPPANAGGEVAIWIGAKFGPALKYRYKVVR